MRCKVCGKYESESHETRKCRVCRNKEIRELKEKIWGK